MSDGSKVFRDPIWLPYLGAWPTLFGTLFAQLGYFGAPNRVRNPIWRMPKKTPASAPSKAGFLSTYHTMLPRFPCHILCTLLGVVDPRGHPAWAAWGALALVLGEPAVVELLRQSKHASTWAKREPILVHSDRNGPRTTDLEFTNPA